MNCIELTRQLIRSPSESSNQTVSDAVNPEKFIIERLKEICDKSGITYELQEALPHRFNFISYFPSSIKNAKKLLLVGHMDTVSGSGNDQSFSGQIKDNKIWGRGACDDKGPLACAFGTLVNLHKHQTSLAYDVIFAATVDEECTMSGATALADKIKEWDLCIGLEPTLLKLIKAHKGVFRSTITTKGIAVHSSAPQRGENAIIGMYNIMTDLQTLEFKIKRRPDPELGHASLAITQINGGTSSNIIPANCSITLDIRLLPHHKPEDIERTLQQLVGERGVVECSFSAKGISTDMDNPLINHLQKAISECGYSSEPGTVSYATDCSQLIDNGPCIVWGPGSIDQAHQDDEFIEIKQLEDACRILEKFLTA